MYKRSFVQGAATLLAAATGARAVVITGSHDNKTRAYGYEARSGAYEVSADTNGVPSATFNNNDEGGLGAIGPGVSVTVAGGQFDGNFIAGIAVKEGATATISGGSFNNNLLAVVAGEGSLVTIYGGQFLNSSRCLYSGAGGTFEIYGGQFSVKSNGDPNNLIMGLGSGTIMNVYGAFDGVAEGQTVTLPFSLSGSFYGRLQNNTAAQFFTYGGGPGTIILHGTGTLVPEPATLGLCAVGGTMLLSRRHCRATKAR